MMFNINNSQNEIPSDATVNDTNSGMGRSVSSARFQIAKVPNNDTNAENSLGKAISIPNSLSQTVEKTSISNTTKIKISVGDDANESG
ncbi:unnamed protein product, partial [Rotaria magnacalcarata]